MKTINAAHWRLVISVSLAFMAGQTLWVPPVLAATINVPSQGIATIQDGINAATNGDTVLVADGVYPGGINFNGKLIVVKSANGPANCIISGGHTDLGVKFDAGEGAAARLDGFIIRNGRSTSGGGIHVGSQAAPTIANCIITNNQSVASAGGGINIDSASPTITNCNISANWAGVDAQDSSYENFSGSGGGIFCKGLSRPLIVDCVISTNHAYGKNGGGIHCYNSSPTIRRCTIVGNSVEQDGGGISCKDEAAPVIVDCTITGNSGGSQGGGVNMSRSSPTIRHCLISENRCVFDGGISIWDNSFPLIYDCTIAKNRANYYGSKYAGGIGVQQSSPMIANCLIWGNSCVGGAGGIMVYDSSYPTIVNCTISANQATTTDPAKGAGGIYSIDSVTTVVNCILWGDIGWEILVKNSVFYPNRVPVVSYSDVPWGGTGNFHADPLFVDPANADFRLRAGSPCIDTGSNAKAPDDDLDGTPRPQDGNGDGLAIVDMGAYEVVGSPALSSRFILDPSDPDYIPDAAFRTSHKRVALGNKIKVALRMISHGRYNQALANLKYDILRKTNGCAATGAPDKNDWIVSCESQEIIYVRVTRAIQALETLTAIDGTGQ